MPPVSSRRALDTGALRLLRIDARAIQLRIASAALARASTISRAVRRTLHLRSNVVVTIAEGVIRRAVDIPGHDCRTSRRRRCIASGQTKGEARLIGKLRLKGRHIALACRLHGRVALTGRGRTRPIAVTGHHGNRRMCRTNAKHQARQQERSEPRHSTSRRRTQRRSTHRRRKQR